MSAPNQEATKVAADLKENSKIAAKMLKAIANESRLLILCGLEGKELSVTDINEQLDLSQSALSQHLASLRKAELVQTRREAQTIFYSLRGDEAIQIITVLKSIYCPAL